MLAGRICARHLVASAVAAGLSDLCRDHAKGVYRRPTSAAPPRALSPSWLVQSLFGNQALN